jgi:hypothetical protein
MVIFHTFKQFPWSGCGIRAPTTPTTTKSYKTSNIVINICSNEDTPKPPCILPLTIVENLIKFCQSKIIKS